MTKKKLKPEWHSAVCYNAQTMSKLSRETLELLNFKFERERSYKSYSKLMIIFPLPRYSYVFQFKVKEPSEFVLNFYDTKPTPSGELHLMEIENISDENISDIKRYLKKLASNMDRKPWQFFWSERFRYALAAPEYLRAKKAWREMDVE